MKDLVGVIDDAGAGSEAIHDAVARVAKSIVDDVTREGIFGTITYVVTERIDHRRAALALWKGIKEEWEAEFTLQVSLEEMRRPTEVSIRA